MTCAESTRHPDRRWTGPACGGAGSLPMTRNVPDPLQPGVFRTEVYQATCGTCGAYFVVEADGSVYPCDFFALDEWRLGRLGEQSLEEMAASETAVRFLAWGREKPPECTECPWKSLCNGGCKNDWTQGHNYFCEAFRMLFEHAFARMRVIAQAELRQRQVIKGGRRQ